MKALALITARGGSVTLPRKNVLPFCGKPLIAYSIEAALAAKRAGAPIERIVVSTDDTEIMEVSRQFGAEVPFRRPAELAQPDTPSLPVVQHAIAHAERDGGLRYDWILLLQPTSPLRTRDDVLAAFALAARPQTSSVIGITSANSSHPAKLKLIENGMLKPYLGNDMQQARRQDFGFDVYRTNGAIYLTLRDAIVEDGSFYGPYPRPYLMPPERSIDIDTQLDFEMAEFLWRRSDGKAEVPTTDLVRSL
jgi:CMP-N-acetylneuraminic acid synthetase